MDMKFKFTVFLFSLFSTVSAFAGDPLGGPPGGPTTPLPEPSILGLLLAGGIAATVIQRLKK